MQPKNWTAEALQGDQVRWAEGWTFVFCEDVINASGVHMY